VRSPLTEVPGVGQKIAERLTDQFGTLDRVRAATVDELQTVRGVSARLARTIQKTLGA
jgi:excinuclease ABC subunit C